VSKARRVLGWKPEIGFDEGLPQLIDWFRKEGR
jgi:nucleoside-diphosphate-sugar epimerase